MITVLYCSGCTKLDRFPIYEWDRMEMDFWFLGGLDDRNIVYLWRYYITNIINIFYYITLLFIKNRNEVAGLQALTAFLIPYHKKFGQE
ncbi:hypothetical protein RhiirB3_533480 [Rhizophagus irregularis]|nr:hypothetical protein RhiirB3_533343 [Rhizophagus irregularis]PKY36078.1 hypothetical protein RhiirB3_533413 [Rhizophagus irregularis]PKY36265.1 hypothetical protein RhiirB3_533480 [Rhizophagus irregularis]